MIYRLCILIISKCTQNSLSFLFDLWQTQEPLENVHIQKSLRSEEQQCLSFKNSENNSVSPETPIPQHEKDKDMGICLCWARRWLCREKSGKKRRFRPSPCREPWKARAEGSQAHAWQPPRTSTSQWAMPGSSEWGPQKKPINQHGHDQAHQSVKSAYCQCKAWPQSRLSIKYGLVSMENQRTASPCSDCQFSTPP